MRKAPFRPDNEISQTFNSGVCTIYRQRDTARPGYKPRPELGVKAVLRFEEQRMGLNRYYAARQVDIEAERVLRVPKPPVGQMPTPQDVVTTDGAVFYRIDLVQTVPGVWPPSLDLTLVRYERGDPPQSPAATAPPQGGSLPLNGGGAERSEAEGVSS